MKNPQLPPAFGDGIAPRLVIEVQRLARPPTPWTWAIPEKGRAEPFRCSTRLHRPAEDAWTAGHAMLDRPPKSAVINSAEARRNAVSERDPDAG